jgi:hypothetical protein
LLVTSVQCVHVRSFAEQREFQLLWPCPLALEARRRPPPAPQASSAKSWARQLPECHENWRSAVRLHLIGTCLTTRLTYLVPQPYIIVACVGCGQKKTAAATLKATGGLSCVLSAGISVPEEEVAPLDARQQVLGATGWYDRSCIMAGHAPAARAGRHSSCPIQDELSQA